MQAAKIYIDGGARGNPGAAGIGIVIKDGDNKLVKELHKYIGETTNNIAEYTALIYALQEALMLGLKDIAVYSDSELLVKQLKGEYKVKNQNLKIYYDQFLHLRPGFKSFSVKHIAREKNKEADKLVNQAIDLRFIGAFRATQAK